MLPPTRTHVQEANSCLHTREIHVREEENPTTEAIPKVVRQTFQKQTQMFRQWSTTTQLPTVCLQTHDSGCLGGVVLPAAPVARGKADRSVCAGLFAYLLPIVPT